jgi:hypothetical protein
MIVMSQTPSLTRGVMLPPAGEIEAPR